MNNQNRILFILLPALLAGTFFLGSCNRQDSATTILDGFAQGSTYHIVIKSDRERPELQASIDSLLGVIDQSMSLFNDSSLLSKLNRNETDQVDTMITYCIGVADRISRESDGLYDITIKPVFEAWGFLGNGSKEDPDIDSLLQYVGYGKIKVEDGRLVKERPEVQIDLSSIAQGFSADLLAQLLEQKGITEYMVEIGGEIFCRGSNPEGTQWRVGIDKPIEGNVTPGADMQVRLYISELGLATSGNYRKYHTDSKGRKIVHTLNPKTGYSEISNLLSATVIAPNATQADAYGTMMMVMGLDRAVAFLEKRPDLMGYLVYTDENGNFKTWSSPELDKRVIH